MRKLEYHNKASEIGLGFIYAAVSWPIYFYFLGNILVIITVIGYLNKRNVTNMFIVNLSVGDVLVILFALPLKVNTLTLLHSE